MRIIFVYMYDHDHYDHFVVVVVAFNKCLHHVCLLSRAVFICIKIFFYFPKKKSTQNKIVIKIKDVHKNDDDVDHVDDQERRNHEIYVLALVPKII